MIIIGFLPCAVCWRPGTNPFAHRLWCSTLKDIEPWRLEREVVLP